MSQSHAASHRLFIDYAGDSAPVVIERRTGERRSAHMFVVVRGARNFSCAQVIWMQSLCDM